MSIKLSDTAKKQYITYIGLLSSVLNGTRPPEVSADFDWESICRNAQRNSVANILAYAVIKSGLKPPRTVANVIENERRYQILKETSQLVDIEKVIEEFEKEKIKNIPLKGYFMKRYYPRSDLRSMSDVDILIDRKHFKKAEKIFCAQGFEKTELIKSSEIHFKKGLLYVEVHSTLNEGDDSYYDNVFERAELRDDYYFSYALCPEDFYIYMIYHSAKHFSNGGIGIRMLMDIYVYRQKIQNLDSGYIDLELEKLGLKSFENALRKVSHNWFSEEKTEINELGEFILYCSTFGKLEIYFYQDKKRTDGFYWLKQVFKPMSKMKGAYHYLEKFPFLLPFSWGQYWVTRVFIHRDVNYKTGVSERAATLNEDDQRLVNGLIEELDIK